MTDRERQLVQEIRSLAPAVTILTVGTLFANPELDAIVADRHGQPVWSVYRRYLPPQEKNETEKTETAKNETDKSETALPLEGQLSLF